MFSIMGGILLALKLINEMYVYFTNYKASGTYILEYMFTWI